jgi:hypothetical protein
VPVPPAPSGPEDVPTGQSTAPGTTANGLSRTVSRTGRVSPRSGGVVLRRRGARHAGEEAGRSARWSCRVAPKPRTSRCAGERLPSTVIPARASRPTRVLRRCGTVPCGQAPADEHGPRATSRNALLRSDRPDRSSDELPRGPSRPAPGPRPGVRPYGQLLGSHADGASPGEPSRLLLRHSVGLMPNCRRNHREKALGALKPNSCDTSVSEYRSLGR